MFPRPLALPAAVRPVRRWRNHQSFGKLQFLSRTNSGFAEPVHRLADAGVTLLGHVLRCATVLLLMSIKLTARFNSITVKAAGEVITRYPAGNKAVY